MQTRARQQLGRCISLGVTPLQQPMALQGCRRMWRQPTLQT